MIIVEIREWVAWYDVTVSVLHLLDLTGFIVADLLGDDKPDKPPRNPRDMGNGLLRHGNMIQYRNRKGHIEGRVRDAAQGCFVDHPKIKPEGATTGLDGGSIEIHSNQSCLG